MARHQKRTFGEVTIAGANVKIGAVTVSVLVRNVEGHIAICAGSTKPTDGGAGYAKGCLFIKSNAGDGVKALYENKGLSTSCTFDVVGEIAAGEITLAEAKLLVGAATGLAAAQTLGGDASIIADGTLTIGADKVTYAKMQDVEIESVIANPTAGALNPQGVAIGEAQVLARATGGHVAGQKVVAGMVTLAAGKVLVGTVTSNIASECDISAEGAIVVGQGAGATPLAKTMTTDVTMAKTGAATITDKAVTYAKMQDTAAGFKVIGKPTTAAGAVSEITMGADQVLAKSGAGDIAGQKVVPAMTADIPVGLNYGVPATIVADRFVVSTNMINAGYAVANAAPGDSLARNITVTVTKVDAFDTPGTITVDGTDIDNVVIQEVIIPIDGTAVGAKAFKTVTAITGAGWSAGGGTDQITVGFGGLVGLPLILAAAADLVMATHGVGVLNAPTVAVGAAISQCTIDISTAGDGSKRLRLFYQN